jgi:hypothetical protein
MLKKEDFKVPVKRIIFNGVPCWRYLGDSLSEAVSFARKVRTAGERFFDPLTARVTGVRKAKLNREMVLLMAAMAHYHDFKDHDTMIYPGDFPVVAPKAGEGFTTDYNYLVHFGFLGKERRDDDLHYWVTELGRGFLAGNPVHSSLLHTGALVHGLDPAGELTTISDFFVPTQLEEMQKPLWFLPQAYREEILSPEDLAIEAKA